MKKTHCKCGALLMPKNSTRCTLCARTALREWRKANPERAKAHVEAFTAKHPTYVKDYYAKHKDKAHAYYLKRKALREAGQ